MTVTAIQNGRNKVFRIGSKGAQAHTKIIFCVFSVRSSTSLKVVGYLPHIKTNSVGYERLKKDELSNGRRKIRIFNRASCYECLLLAVSMTVKNLLQVQHHLEKGKGSKLQTHRTKNEE